MSQISQEYITDIEESLKDYPLLRFTDETNKSQIRGTWEVKFENTLIESYEILIDLVPGYPLNVPQVYELGGKIPKHMDRHLTSPNWYACLFVEDARWEAWPIGASFRDFLSIPIHNFFLAQANFDEYGFFPKGEYSHSSKGVKEYYQEKFESKNPFLITTLLYATFLNSSSDNCPCKSGKKTSLCHGRIINIIRNNIPKTIREKAYFLFVEEANSVMSGNYIKRLNFIHTIFQTSPTDLQKQRH